MHVCLDASQDSCILELSAGFMGSSAGQSLLFSAIVIPYVTLGRDLVNLVCFRNFLRTVSCTPTEFSKICLPSGVLKDLLQRRNVGFQCRRPYSTSACYAKVPGDAEATFSLWNYKSQPHSSRWQVPSLRGKLEMEWQWPLDVF